MITLSTNVINKLITFVDNVIMFRYVMTAVIVFDE